MNDIEPIGQTEIEMKIKEADTCHSMGMMREALQICEQILADLPENDVSRFVNRFLQICRKMTTQSGKPSVLKSPN
jgi:hypothetical protein